MKLALSGCVQDRLTSFFEDMYAFDFIVCIAHKVQFISSAASLLTLDSSNTQMPK